MLRFKKNYGLKIIILLFIFPLAATKSFTQTKTPDINAEYYKIEKMPSFPGGDKKRIKFVNKNLVIPKEAKKQGIKGTVKIMFTIDSTGTIIKETVKVMQCVHPLLDEEAIRVVKLFPQWTPAYTAEKAVNCYFIMPIKFDY
jgi:TonB family protein